MHPQVVETQRPGVHFDPESICARSIIGIHMTHNCVLRGSARGSPCQPERLNKAAEVQQSGMPIIALQKEFCMPETARRFPMSGALSRIVVLAFVASVLFFWAPGGGRAFAAPNPPVGTLGHIDEYNSAPSASESVSDPVGITSGPGSTLIFVDEPNSTVGRINTNGTGIVATNTNAGGASPLGITKGADSNYYFTESNISVDQTARFNVPGGSINEFNVVPPGSQPWGITAGPSGDPNGLWYTENATGNIGRITTTAAGGDTGSAFPLASGGAPVAIVAGPAGHIW